jgi:hypothetical protein
VELTFKAVALRNELNNNDTLTGLDKELLADLKDVAEQIQSFLDKIEEQSPSNKHSSVSLPYGQRQDNFWIVKVLRVQHALCTTKSCIFWAAGSIW